MLILFAAAASIPVVGFNAVYMSEHFGAFLTCAVLHAVFFVSYIQAVVVTMAGSGCAEDAIDAMHWEPPASCRLTVA